ncbi:MAG: S9 family peptidase [Bacteroidales bacterium]|nr:S9 family peptidase [Candidatus Cryptobacteroides equifaecalis]
MKKTVLFLLLSSFALGVQAEEKEVFEYRFSGLYELKNAHIVDSLDVNGKRFELKNLLDSAIPTVHVDELPWAKGTAQAGREESIREGACYARMMGFKLDNSSFTKLGVKISGTEDYRLYVDGVSNSGSGIQLEPGTHEFLVKYLLTDSLKVSYELSCGDAVQTFGPGRRFSLDANTIGRSCRGVSVSPDGKYALISYNTVFAGGASETKTDLVSLADGRCLLSSDTQLAWLANSCEYWYTEKSLEGGRDIIAVSPKDGSRRVLASRIPEGYFVISPSEDYLIYYQYQEGPKEGEVHQILTPDDRQPGWRSRSNLARYDIASGVMQPLTFGHHNAYLADISCDGRTLLFSTYRERLTQRPTTLSSYYTMDLETLETRCVIEDDGFIAGVSFSPDGKQLLVRASAEAFGGFASEVKQGQTPNTFHYLLYVLTLEDLSVKTITPGFGPSPLDCVWSRADGRVYTRTEDGDCHGLYSINPLDGKIQKIDLQEEYITSLDLAYNAPTLAYCGQSLENADRVYALDLKKKKSVLLNDLSSERLSGVEMGQGGSYEFTSSRGDRITAFFVTPPDMDPDRKYPMLVHYYGGCSPSLRYAVGSYSPQYYAAQGYVFMVVNPSGASGMGQEFAARHVNTAGDVVSDDIIEAVQNFCKDHPYVNTEKIGCFSASYGGFMTQLLLTKTDMFACGISHAGISSHTSYWGEGYWGYSYSETSMANSYPWTRKDLYVDRSPLYNADKIHTPLLFLHGSADTNVPIGESIQMFTALKLLGQDTAFVVVDGENHGIREFNKRRQWLRTISAWFSKYLKDDPSWWNELYPEKNL